MSGVQQYKVADKVFLEKQREILRLFQHVHQPTYFKDLIELAKTFKFEGHWDQWTKTEYAQQFWQYYNEEDFLKQDEIFSVFHPEHLKQAVALFKVFFYAKDFATFYKCAVWARQHVNPGMFVYALSVAVFHCKHTEGIILPPIYEIFPHYFFTSEVITKAKQYKEEMKKKSDFIVHAEYTKYEEEYLSYFTEDIGVNAYYYYMNIFTPFWLEREFSKYEDIHYGEWFHYYHNQILARYYLERLANGKGQIPTVEYAEPTKFGYYPSLTYFNGKPFPSRPKNVQLNFDYEDQETHTLKHYSINCHSKVEDYEMRIRDAIDMGWVYTPEGKIVYLYTEEGFDTLGRIVECQPESPNVRFYGYLQMVTRHLLGYSHNALAPSVLEHFETSMRDPMFYQFCKKMMYFFHRHQHHMGPHERHHLHFQGVKIDDFQVDHLVTFFDEHCTDISNALTVDEEEFTEQSCDVQARQFRLNHKPYNYKIHVSSDKSVDAFVKVFIGPKHDEFGHEMQMKHNYMNFYELDRFKCTLKSGQNVIERNSRETPNFITEQYSFKTLYNQVDQALNGGESFKVYHPQVYYNFPQRLMLPKGTVSGKSYQFFVVVTDYQSTNDLYAECLVDTHYPVSYPLDRPIECEKEFFVPNFFTKDVKVYHEEHQEVEKMLYKKH
ncbi:PREDICTED: allergen Cr-PI-like [Nicrophorus vespilloides]|uniref:Allergen Cr-PI-like n=1 Tax=Nicrophorus vespilloides TaxID=110193 RepID=A0ABM1M858_NICVS|nr:PREDICTED: allergen Cr-PI-like [Nicrophorus vespilloides]XP_017770766.1 PREDICTED: allergen Cr-PI-like [Nicrophorus vespilloides]